MATRWIVLQEFYDDIYDLAPFDIGRNFGAGVGHLHALEISGDQSVTGASLERPLFAVAHFQEAVAVIKLCNRWGRY